MLLLLLSLVMNYLLLLLTGRILKGLLLLLVLGRRCRVVHYGLGRRLLQRCRSRRWNRLKR